jgi:glycerol kinase
MKYILSIDQGTTGTTALLIDRENFKIIDRENQEYPQHYPKPGWVEHDLNDIWSTVENTIKTVLTKHKVAGNQIVSIGITNQRETTCAFTKDGVPLANAIVWQDRRTEDFCNENKSKFAQQFYQKTGLPLDPYFSATKMRWLLKNNSNVENAAKNNNLLFGTIDSFLLYKLTHTNSYYTDTTNASRTLLMDLKTCVWDDALLAFFGIKEEFLPTIKNSFTNFGTTSGLTFLPDGIPISCILGDQQAALFGQAAVNKGDMKCTYGTGAFMLVNTGADIILNANSGLLTTIAFSHNDRHVYALEGSTYIAGAAVQWLRDNLNIIESSAEIEELANQITNLEEMEFIQFLPFFTGIGSPHWVSNAKASILGLSRDTTKAHIARACLEGIALSITDSIKAFQKELGNSISQIRVDGGAASNNLLLQLQANFSGVKIIRPDIIETTAYGVALGALLGLGEIQLDDLHKYWNLNQEFSPQEDLTYYYNKIAMWNTNISKLYL